MLKISKKYIHFEQNYDFLLLRIPKLRFELQALILEFKAKLWNIKPEFLKMKLDAKIPSGPLSEKWSQHKFDLKLVNPTNKRKYDIIVVGTGLAGSAAAATLAELGYNVKVFCFQDSARRAHSVAAQGGINASKKLPR
ncbi:succinate dehydrogenase or fumarate reductase, flavoprotein subunit [Beggiatoa sp. PS]|nr:succinate dehydrogenase or fumarate reductase, flavoprotein subunit [Beggiatoa sp. PS]